MKDIKKTPLSPKLLWTTLGTLGSFAILLFVLLVAYLPNRPQSVDQATVAERRTKLAELQAREKDLTTTYGWVDPSKGIVRIPVERAKELILQEEINMNKANVGAPQKEE